VAPYKDPRIEYFDVENKKKSFKLTGKKVIIGRSSTSGTRYFIFIPILFLLLLIAK
jgi:hypothetical protein